MWSLLYGFCEEVNKIKSSNILAFFWLYKGNFYGSKSVYLTYFKDWFYYEIEEKFNKFRENQLTFLGLWLIKIWFHIRYFKSFTPVIEDGKKEGWNICPRYELYIIDEEVVEMGKLKKVYFFWTKIGNLFRNARISFTQRNEDGNMNKRGFYIKEEGEEE